MNLPQEKSVRKRYTFNIHHLAVIPYKEALDLQFSYWEDVQEGGDDYLILLQHNPVVTMGRRTDPSHLLFTNQELKDHGIELFKVDRGGSATYHGPGQLIGYVICKTSRYGGIHNVVLNILTALRQFIENLGIDVRVDKDNPGIWTNTEPPRKLAAVGMQNKKGVSLHGFALNVDLPLTGFSAIVPCGLELPVSTLAIELGKNLDVEVIQEKVVAYLLAEFNAS